MIRTTTTFRSNSATIRVLRDMLRYVPSTILPTMFAMFAVYIYTREFTATQYGVYNFVLSITTPATLLLTEWAAQPIGRYYAEYESQGKLNMYRQGVVTLITIILGVVVLISLAVACILITRYSFSILIYSGVVVSVLTQCAFVLTSRILPSSLRADRYGQIIVWVSAISIGLSLLMIQILSRNVGWLFWGQAFANMTLLPLLFKWNHLSFRGDYMFKLTPEFKALFHQFCKYGAPMLLWVLSNNLLDDEDRWILQWFHGSVQVGIYSVNYNLISAVGNFMNVPVIMAVGPILYHQWSSRHIEEAKQTISGMTEIYSILAATVLGGTIVVGTPVVHLFLGTSFWRGATILVPVLIGRIFWGAGSIGHRTLELSERTLTMGISGLMAAGINLLLNLIFVPRFGYQAAAWSTAMSYAAYAVIIHFQSRRYVFWKINLLYVSLYVGIGVLCAGVTRIWIWKWWLGQSSPLAQLTMGLSIYLIIYGGCLCLIMKKRILKLLRFQF